MSVALPTKEEAEDIISRSTTDYGKVICLYVDENFVLLKWPGGPLYNVLGTQYISPWVDRYKTSDVVECLRRQSAKLFVGRLHGFEVWNCRRSENGSLTKKRLAALIEKEKSRPLCKKCGRGKITSPTGRVRCDCSFS